MAETEEETTETRHALDQDADEETPPVSNTWERDLNAASKAIGVSTYVTHTLNNKEFNEPVFPANTIKVTRTGEPQKPRADMILNLLNKSNPDVKRLWTRECGVKKEAKEITDDDYRFCATRLAEKLKNNQVFAFLAMRFMSRSMESTGMPCICGRTEISCAERPPIIACLTSIE